MISLLKFRSRRFTPTRIPMTDPCFSYHQILQIGFQFDLPSRTLTVGANDFQLEPDLSETSSLEAMTLKLQAHEASLLPIGSILSYGGQFLDQLPGIWLPCDGKALERAHYSSLFHAIGVSHGDGSDAPGHANRLFNLPDLRGVFIRGVDPIGREDPEAAAREARKPGGHNGAQVGSYQADCFQAHNHPTRQTPHSHGIYFGRAAHGNSGLLCDRSDAGFETLHGRGTERATIDLEVLPSGGIETRPKNVALYMIIRVL